MAIHTLKIMPGTKDDERFHELLESIGVKIDLVICRLGSIFKTPYDEYILSDGLYRMLYDDLEQIRKGPV